MTIEFELSGLPKSTNGLMSAHWSVKHKMTREWTERVHYVLQVGGLMPKSPFNKATLTLTRFSSSEPDFDGLVSSFKWIVDALIKCGVIVNDKPSVIGQPKYEWIKAPRGQGKIRVRVEAK